MWILKLKYWHENSYALEYAKKFNIVFTSFPINHYKKGKFVCFDFVHYVLGSEENKKAYFAAVKKNPKITNFESYGDFYVYTHKSSAKSHLQLFISPEIMFIKPLTVYPQGYQTVTFGAWKKESLTKMLKKMKKFVHYEVESIVQEPLKDFFIPHAVPSLPEKQKELIRYAFEQGYYEFPKKANIKELAKRKGLSASTFTENLRKAEQKIIPFVLENLMP
ncbi:MAG: helix-turn-helix domain-containing protein [Candidatus Diapherotrites archaeon]|nr:helix-turn-helix domain-containing protein [Candidatus Diapherotrites archaeon]